MIIIYHGMKTKSLVKSPDFETLPQFLYSRRILITSYCKNQCLSVTWSLHPSLPWKCFWIGNICHGLPEIAVKRRVLDVITICSLYFPSTVFEAVALTNSYLLGPFLYSVDLQDCQREQSWTDLRELYKRGDNFVPGAEHKRADWRRYENLRDRLEIWQWTSEVWSVRIF